MEENKFIENKFYTISEVSERTGVKTHVLRYWEKEFASLRPIKDPSGFRRFRKKDIEQVFKIRKYICEDGFTVAGARRALKEEKTGNTEKKQDKNIILYNLREELNELLQIVNDYKTET